MCGHPPHRWDTPGTLRAIQAVSALMVQTAVTPQDMCSLTDGPTAG